MLTNFDDLSKVPGVTPAVLNVVKSGFALGPFTIRGIEIVGPKVGAELRRQATFVTLYALGGMLVYIAFRFTGGQVGGQLFSFPKGVAGMVVWVLDKTIYGLAAVLAVFHDVLITLGFFSLFRFEISLTVIAALLTLVGYSMNDTIVIFDRIRENLKLSRREPLEQLINRSVNQTLSRTVMTSGLTFLTVLALFLFGGAVLHGFSFALVVGIIIGTYSSVFIASPIVLFWHDWFDKRKRSAAVAAPARASTGKESAGKGSMRAMK